MHSVVILIIASFLGCNADNTKRVVQGNHDFTTKTYEELVKISGNNNIVVSGLSAEIILSLLANGAGGETHKQLLNGLSLPNNIRDVNKAFHEITSDLNIDIPDLKLLSANKIYQSQSYPIVQEFKDIARSTYSADVENLELNDPEKAANTINGWVEQKTNNKIKNLIDPKIFEDRDVALVLVNALYYTGKWAFPFEKHNTADRLFYSSSTESKKIPTMSTKIFAKYAYNPNVRAKYLQLRFNPGDVIMTIVLPDEINGLAAAEQNLKEYLAPQQMEVASVNVTLPIFKIETEIDFIPILKKFGITRIFENDADLSHMAKGPIKVSSVLQKACIKLNENGVEAAAATAAIVTKTSAGFTTNIQTFNADHPFLFYISHNNLLLFMGRFMQ
ncbi:antichymotrypsin-2-like isoform X1 [Diabrotica virgifera virgifera]|uniref:Antichymotrypsin-2-like isoform X1 n=1 Tax=Diabrotica virgifera virgifera TaxID=50390 RepID=A0A6P7GES6_DIAVI|nr:antichymotrypsin-2-like isoform X1 [Diabrotica virgifera virgifera]